MSYGDAQPYYWFLMSRLILFIQLQDGHWSTWSNWSRCSDSCGNGTMTRTRQCDNPPPLAGGLNCPGSANESSPCKLQDCHGEFK